MREPLASETAVLFNCAGDVGAGPTAHGGLGAGRPAPPVRRRAWLQLREKPGEAEAQLGSSPPLSAPLHYHPCGLGAGGRASAEAAAALQQRQDSHQHASSSAAAEGGRGSSRAAGARSGVPLRPASARRWSAASWAAPAISNAGSASCMAIPVRRPQPPPPPPQDGGDGGGGEALGEGGGEAAAAAAEPQGRPAEAGGSPAAEGGPEAAQALGAWEPARPKRPAASPPEGPAQDGQPPAQRPEWQRRPPGPPGPRKDRRAAAPALKQPTKPPKPEEPFWLRRLAARLLHALQGVDPYR